MNKKLLLGVFGLLLQNAYIQPAAAPKKTIPANELGNEIVTLWQCEDILKAHLTQNPKDAKTKEALTNIERRLQDITKLMNESGGSYPLYSTPLFPNQK